jgi:hypothetical protein
MRLVCLLHLFLFSLRVSSAQRPSASISGKVTDPAGHAITNGAVIAVAADGKTLQQTTGNEGRFTFAAIPESKHMLNVNVPGFEPFTRPLAIRRDAEPLTVDRQTMNRRGITS